MSNESKRSKKKTKSHNLGLSLVELIVVIAIMSVLVGLAVPNFVSYVSKNRKKACHTNRESAINVFVRLVYNDSLDANTTDINKVLNKPGDCPTDSFTTKALSEITQYNDSSNSHRLNYTASVDGTTGHAICKIVCSECGDTVELDLAEWSVAAVDEGDDNPNPSPVWPSKTPTDVPDTSSEEQTSDPDDPPVVDSGYWPYQDSDRWTQVGAVVGKKIILEVPSGIQTSRSGARYVIIGSKNGGTYNLEYEKAISPEYLFTIDAQHVVIISGKFMTESDAYYKNNNKDTLYFNDVSYGDVVTVEGNDGRKYKYVCWMASPSEGEVQINKGAVGQWTIAGWTRVDR